MTPPRPQPTYADVLVERYRELRGSGRFEPPEWMRKKPTEREIRLLFVALGLTALQVLLAAAIWNHSPVKAAAPFHKPYVEPRIIEPAKPRALNQTVEPKVPFLFGAIVRTDQTFECNGPVKIGLLKVTMTKAVQSDRSLADAVHFYAGCTGEIGRIEITQSAGDGVKIHEGAHDLRIYGGFVRCLDKSPTLHQDGIQAMGGARIKFENISVDCGHGAGDLVNSNFFIRQAGKSIVPPTDIVCDHCRFGSGAAHTVSVQDSLRSGVTNSILCPALYRRQMFAVGEDAVEPLTTGNVIGACGGKKAGRPVRVVTHD